MTRWRRRPRQSTPARPARSPRPPRASRSPTPRCGAVLECRVDSEPFAVCPSPADYANLAQGSHTFQVRAKDAVGNLSETISRTWTADTVAPPAPTIDTGPHGLSATAAPTFTFSDTEAGVTFECSRDGEPYTTCTSPKGYTSLAETSHTFDVRAKDAVGHTSAATSRTWTVDVTAPPIPTIDSGPTGTVATTSATFAFSDTEAGVTFECKLDTGAFAACTSPANLSGLAQGSHSYEVRAKDAAGNTASSTRAWAVDSVAPNTTITAGPKTGKATTATFKFTATEAGSTFKCKLDKGAWAACKTGKIYKKLKKGSHTFQVAATDKYGNLDKTPAKKTWKVT